MSLEPKSNETSCLLCEELGESNGGKNGKSLIRHKVVVGRRTATLHEGHSFWTVRYNPKNGGLGHNSPGLSIGCKVSPDRVREILENLERAAVALDRSREMEMAV
jgi:hypothetical protein